MSDSTADEKRAFGLMAAVGANMDRLRQSIANLCQLHDRWKDNSGISINLIAQLTALRSNLNEMQDWMKFALSDMHPQLLRDLDLLMTSCSLMIRNLDDLLLQLRQPDHDNTDWAVKLKFTVGSRSMVRLRSVAKRQTDAVSLLLAACKCHTTAQRKILLHKSRQIRKDDSSSLSTLVHTSRWNGQAIKTLTQLSRMIQWFRLLFYVKLFRKRSDETPTEQEYLDAAAIMRSEAIDRVLEEDATQLRRENKLVLMGYRCSGNDLIMNQMRALYAEGFTLKERKLMADSVRHKICLLMHAIINLLKDTGVKLTPALNQDFAVLLNEVERCDDRHISAAAVRATQNIWSSTLFTTLYIRNFEIDFPQYAPYFAQELPRIAAQDYIPTEADMVRVDMHFKTLKELRFQWDELDVHLFNVNSYIPEPFRKRWLHQLEGSTAIIYTVDVSTYDRPFYGQANESQLLDHFAAFEATVNSPLFAGAALILILNNFSRFRDKLPHAPLASFFPDYAPPPDLDPETAARQYILRRFKDVNRNRLSIYSFWVDLDISDNQHLFAALKKTLLHIQQRRARSEVWDRSTDGGSRGTMAGGSTPVARIRSTTTERSGTSRGKGSGSGSGTGTGVTSPGMSAVTTVTSASSSSSK